MDSFTRNNNLLIEQQRQQLERILRQEIPSTAQHSLRWQQFLGRMFGALVHWLTAGDAPRIHRMTVGETEIWKVYDPVDHRTHYFDHENAVRDWLDQRFNQ